MKTYLIGMGGIGMSGLAQLLLSTGTEVAGADLAKSAMLTRLRVMGARAFVGHEASQLGEAQRVVYSSSIPPSNPELLAARNRGLCVLQRGQMLHQLLFKRKTIAVTGTHGKSTTAALASSLLLEAGKDPLVALGAEVDALGGNARCGEGEFAVVEADESDGSLLWLRPWAALLTNADHEHLDYFRNMGEILETYALFVERVVPGGAVIGCADDPLLGKVLAASKKNLLTYGLSPQAQFRAVDINLGAGFSRYRCFRKGHFLGNIHLNIPGLHNVVNSLAVAALAEALGIEFSVVQTALSKYRGAKRRFQIQAQVNGVMVVEDYAHHPAEIEATLQAARGWPERRLRCVFQPHRYSRTRYLLGRFGIAFDQADELILLPIYAASEDPIDGVGSELLLQSVLSGGKVPASLKSAEEALTHLASSARPGDMVLFLGAGSVGGLSRHLADALREKHGERLKEDAHAA